LDQICNVKHTSWFTPMFIWNKNSRFSDSNICRYNAIIVCFNSTCKQWNMSTLKFGSDFTTFCFVLKPILLGSVLTFIHLHLSWFQLCNKKCFIGLVNLDQIPQIFSNLQNQNKQSYKSIQPKGTTLKFFFATSKVFKTKPNSYYIEKQ
jgi:hypothetical protein